MDEYIQSFLPKLLSLPSFWSFLYRQHGKNDEGNGNQHEGHEDNEEGGEQSGDQAISCVPWGNPVASVGPAKEGKSNSIMKRRFTKMYDRSQMENAI